MKTISVVVPTYKEEKNVVPAYEEITRVMTEKLPNYNYEILFIDNDSPDNTRALIRKLCADDPRHVKAIFNARNFGQMRSHFYGITQAQGDCVVLMHADLQNPPAIVPEFVHEWENGAKVVIGIKDNSKESRMIFFLRSCYYKFMKKMSQTEQIEHFSDFELLDQDFVKVLRELQDPMPYLRGIISELGFRIARVHYIQNKRERGKTTANIGVIYDFAMVGITSYTKGVMRIATILGAVFSAISLLVAILAIISKLIYWNQYSLGVAATTVGVYVLGSFQLFFIGLLGEYILNINIRVMKRPLVIEECRINCDKFDGEI